MATNSSENTTDEQLVALNETPQPRDPYCFVDPVWIRRSFSSEEPWIKVRLIKRVSSENNIIASPPAQLYHSQIPLKPAKLKDLQKIASQHVLPIIADFTVV